MRHGLVNGLRPQVQSPAVSAPTLQLRLNPTVLMASSIARFRWEWQSFSLASTHNIILLGMSDVRNDQNSR